MYTDYDMHRNKGRERKQIQGLPVFKKIETVTMLLVRITLTFSESSMYKTFNFRIDNERRHNYPSIDRCKIRIKIKLCYTQLYIILYGLCYVLDQAKLKTDTAIGCATRVRTEMFNMTE